MYCFCPPYCCWAWFMFLGQAWRVGVPGGKMDAILER